MSDRTEEILARHLDGDFTTFPMAERAATREDIAAVCRRTGVQLPPEFVSHVTGRFPGMLVEANEDVWPRAEEYESGPFWTFLSGVHSFTPVPTSEEWMRIDSVAEELRESTGLITAPILQVIGDADFYCVDEGGRIHRFDHELEELEPDDLDFWALLDREIAELAGRKARRLEWDRIGGEAS